MPRSLLKGNIAVCEGAIKAGCRFFFGYPITPQNEIPDYLSWRMPEVGGTFVQAESEVAAISMVYGASCAGARALTTSSSPGISLMQEGISYMVGCELPGVIVNVARGGPGLGNIAPSQSDYLQATKGGGHGDYFLIVLAPWSVQEMFELTYDAFDLSDNYRIPALVLTDGILGQMMEPVDFDTREEASPPAKPWATTGAKGRAKNIINSLYIDPDVLYRHNLRLRARFEQASANEVRYHEYLTEDAEVIVVAYGTSARTAYSACQMAREEGMKVGLFRPITLSPFPEARLCQLAERCQALITVEMSLGQLVYDVRLCSRGRPVHLVSKTAGLIPSPEDVIAAIRECLTEPASQYAQAPASEYQHALDPEE